MRHLKLILPILLFASAARADLPSIDASNASNPFIPGYFADPTVVEHNNTYTLFATIDPFGDDTLGCWTSSNFNNWTFQTLNWPTKKECSSKASSGAKVWAPSVVKAKDGKFYMYVSVGSEVWAGKADAPTGPWTSLTPPNTPLIPKSFDPKYHMIDAEAFIDDDGSAYLYWGSGLNWVNGHCFVVKLKPDMHTFDGTPKDITPKSYFEGPFMLKRNGKYYLMNSTGNTTKDTYAVQYAIGDNPFGPFTDAPNTPILKGDKARNIISTGHHTVFRKNNTDFILYHRAAFPVQKDTNRQLCADLLTFSPEGLINPVTPTFDGAAALQKLCGYTPPATPPERPTITASSNSNGTAKLTDNNFSTRWTPSNSDPAPWLQLDLGKPTDLHAVTILPEFPSRPYAFTLEASPDEKTWTKLADYTTKPATGSPISIPATLNTRYLRLTFPDNTKPAAAGLFEFKAE